MDGLELDSGDKRPTGRLCILSMGLYTSLFLLTFEWNVGYSRESSHGVPRLGLEHGKNN